jgi:hypothetical protein
MEGIQPQKSNNNLPNTKQKYKNEYQGDTIHHMWRPLNPQNNPHNPNTMIATPMALLDMFIAFAMVKT